MFAEKEEHCSLHLNQRHHREHYQKTQNQKNADPAYPEARLEGILKGLEERVNAGRENLSKLRYQRADLEFELKGLQDEKMTLDDALSEAKKGEAFVREKERQINADFMELSDDRKKSDPAPLIKQTLILGRELFSLLLRDVAIEETSRKAFETRVARIEIETAKKAAERNDLQERVLMLQTECQADLEQKRYVYDEIHVLQKRIDSLDAQISMLIEWRKSLEYQITSVRTAIKQRQNIVSDSIVKSSSSKDSENKYFQQTFEQKVLSRDNEIGSSLNKSDNGSVNDGDNEESTLQELHLPTFLMKPGNGGAEEKCSHEIFATNIDPKFGVASFEPSTPAIRSESHTCVSLISDNCMAFASGYSSSVASSPRRANFEKDNDGDDDEIDVEANFTSKNLPKSALFFDVDTTQDSSESDSESEQSSTTSTTSEGSYPNLSQISTKSLSSDFATDGLEADKLNSESETEDDSLLTMRTSRSVLFNLSSPTDSESDVDSDVEDEEETENEKVETSQSTTMASAGTAPFDKVLNQLREVQNMKIPIESSSTTSTKKPFEFEVWQEVLPTEISDSDLSKKKLKKEENEEEKE